MLVYVECFQAVQIVDACLQRIFHYGIVYLHFTHNDIYITVCGIDIYISKTVCGIVLALLWFWIIDKTWFSQ